MASDFSFGIFQLFLESGVLFKNVCGSSDPWKISTIIVKIGMLAFSCCHSLIDVNEIYAEPYLNITIEFENEWCSNICIDTMRIGK